MRRANGRARWSMQCRAWRRCARARGTGPRLPALRQRDAQRGAREWSSRRPGTAKMRKQACEEGWGARGPAVRFSAAVAQYHELVEIAAGERRDGGIEPIMRKLRGALGIGE